MNFILRIFIVITIFFIKNNLFGQVYQSDVHLDKIQGCNNRVEILLDQPKFQDCSFLSLKIMHDANYYIRTTIINFDSEDTLGMPYLSGPKKKGSAFLYFELYKENDGTYNKIVKRNKGEYFYHDEMHSDYLVYPNRRFILDWDFMSLFGFFPEKGKYRVEGHFKKKCNGKLIFDKTNDLYFEVVD